MRREGASSAVTTSSGMSPRRDYRVDVWGMGEGRRLQQRAGSGLASPPPLVWSPSVSSGFAERTERRGGRSDQLPWPTTQLSTR